MLQNLLQNLGVNTVSEFTHCVSVEIENGLAGVSNVLNCQILPLKSISGINTV